MPHPAGRLVPTLAGVLTAVMAALIPGPVEHETGEAGESPATVY